MLDVEDRLAELEELGLYRRMRMVSGPQGPRVVLDGRPVLLLCSDNHLGLADHPRVREAAADAAMRWGAGAGAARLASGTMTLHRRLEERLADFLGTSGALLFGSGYLANLGHRPGARRARRDRVRRRAQPRLGRRRCRLADAETFVYDHGDVEHLAWGLRNADGRAALIVTDGVFALDGDRAPLEEIVALAHRHDVRVLVGESHGARRRRPGRARRGRRRRPRARGRRDRRLASPPRSAPTARSRPATARSPATSRPRALAVGLHRPGAAVIAAAMAALELLREQPRRVEKLQANAELLRTELAREGFDVAGSDAHIVSLVIGDARLALRIAELRARAGRLRRRRAAARRGRGMRAAAAVGHGLAHEVRAARRRPGARPRRAAGRFPAAAGIPLAAAA